MRDTLKPHGSLFDPSLLFEVGSQPVDKLLASYVTLASDPAKRQLIHVARSDDGSELVLQMTYRGAAPLQLTLVLDSKAHFLPTHATQILSGELDEELEWRYGTVNGVTIPTYYKSSKYKHGQLDCQRAVSFVHNEPNVALDESVFDVNALGVRDGDRLVNEMTKQLSVFNAGVLAPVESSVTKADVVAVKRSYRWLLFFNVAVAALLLLAYGIRRMWLRR
jgi:hypothetical protein